MNLNICSKCQKEEILINSAILTKYNDKYKFVLSNGFFKFIHIIILKMNEELENKIQSLLIENNNQSYIDIPINKDFYDIIREITEFHCYIADIVNPKANSLHEIKCPYYIEHLMNNWSENER